MATLDLFSKRQKKLRGEVPDVYQYENIPTPCRVQIIHILREALGDIRAIQVLEVYEDIHDTLCREYGLLSLKENAQYVGIDHHEDVLNFLLHTKDVEQVLDVVEISFQIISTLYRDDYRYIRQAKISPDEAISELNTRFREHGVGYQFESDEIIRVDSQFLHSEAVKPTLSLLSDQQFEGANEEFLKAHEHYRYGNYEESINECLKAFESVMKAICDERGWSYDPRVIRFLCKPLECQ